MITANPLAPGCENASENPLGSAYYNGTKVHLLNLVGIDTSLATLDYIAEAVNTKGPFTADLGQQIVFKTSSIVFSGTHTDITDYTVLTRFFRLIPQLTSVGGDGVLTEGVNLITNLDLMPDGDSSLDPEINFDLFINLGDIGLASIEDAFNAGKPAPAAGDPWLIVGETFVTAIMDGDPTIFLFLGALGNWGGDEAGIDPEILIATAADFDNLSAQPIIIPPNKLSDLDDVSNVPPLDREAPIWDAAAERFVFLNAKLDKQNTVNPISGAVNLDISAFDQHDFVLGAPLTLAAINLPPAGFGKTIAIKVTGDFALTLPAWDVIKGTYDGTAINLIVVTYFGAYSWATINQNT